MGSTPGSQGQPKIWATLPAHCQFPPEQLSEEGQGLLPPVRAQQGRERGAEMIEGGRRQRNKGFDMRNSDGEVLQPLG